MGKIIAITNQKGGVGKTTTALNLGSCLGELKRKVLIVDIDPQGNATQGLGIDKMKLVQEKKTVNDLLLNSKIMIEDVIINTKYQNVDVISSSPNLSAFDVDYSGEKQKELVLRDKLSYVKKNYDYIILDCPPSLSTVTISGLTAANSVLIPVQSEFYALEGMTQLLHTIKLCKKHLNPALKVEGILLTMYATNTNLSESVFDEVNMYFEKYVYKTVIRRNISIAEAPSHGKPINYFDSRSKGTEDYLALAKEVISHE